MKFRMVEELALEQQDVARCCMELKVSRSGYYEWLVRPQSQRKTENQKLAEEIKLHWETSRKRYGLPRILNELRKTRPKLGKNRVARIMREGGIQGVGKKKFKPQTTDSKHELPIADRVFKAEIAAEQVTKPNQFWGGDITYIATEEGWLYLAIVLDLFTRKVVGHSMDESMKSELILDALGMALKRQDPLEVAQLTAHSDRGTQYASDAYRERLALLKITASMSRKGNCYDNAFVESFFRTLKVEIVYRTKFKTREEAKAAIFEFIEVWYNRQRTHSSLAYATPVEYETKALKSA